METSFLWLIPFFPLVGFLVNGLLSMASGRGRRGPSHGFVATIACLAPALSFVVTWMCWSRLGNVLANVQGQEGYRGQALPLAQTLWTWIEGGSFSLTLGLQVDRLTCLMLLFVTGIGTLIHVYSIGYMHADRGFARFMAYLNLFMVSMIVLVMGDSLPAAFLGWEGVGLCSYLLIGFWWKDHANNDAARKAFIMNRVGDLGFVLGAFALFVAMRGIADDVATQVASMATADVTTGSNPELRTLAATLGGNVGLSFRSIAAFFDFSNLPLMQTAIAGQAGWLGAATLLIFLGCTGKSAQLPLLTWLPDAMAGPTPVSALIHAATMVTAGVYLCARMAPVFALTPDTMQVILWIGCATALFGAIAGIVQNDIKKVLAYSTVSQLGFMFMAVGVGAFDVALFHVFTHAFFKATLFLGAGSVIHALHHEQDIRRMGGLAKAMPWTHGMMLFAFAAIIGFPATSGFFSKDLILERLHESGNGSAEMVFWIAVLTAAITAFYMTRMMCLVFWSPSRQTAQQQAAVHEAPFTMTLPVVILGFGSLVAGVIWAEYLYVVPLHLNSLQAWLFPVLGPAQQTFTGAGPHVPDPSKGVPMMVPMLATFVGLIGVIFALMLFRRGPSRSVAPGVALPALSRFGALWTHGLDRIYDALIIRPLRGLGWVLAFIVDNAVIGGVGRRIGSAAYSLAIGYTIFQRGRLRSSLAISLIGVLAFLDLLLVGGIERALAAVRSLIP